LEDRVDGLVGVAGDVGIDGDLEVEFGGLRAVGGISEDGEFVGIEAEATSEVRDESDLEIAETSGIRDKGVDEVACAAVCNDGLDGEAVDIWRRDSCCGSRRRVGINGCCHCHHGCCCR